MQYPEIIIIGDDDDDRAVFKIALGELNIENIARFFADAVAALEYIKSVHTSPFLIICDMNMHGVNGLEFKQLLNDYNDSKTIAIPFVFVSTIVSPTVLRYSRCLNIQGYFQKPICVLELRKVLHRTVKYWQSAYQAFDL